MSLDLRKLENYLKATEGIDKVYSLAANMGGIGFITSVFADVIHENVLINTFMLEASVPNKVVEENPKAYTFEKRVRLQR